MSATKKLRLRKKTSIPVLVGALGFVVFMFFLVEPTIKFSLKKSLEVIGGSEVNIESVEFSLLKGEFAVNELQITDPNKPDFNLISFEKFKFLIDPVSLLKLKFIIDDASLENLIFASKRENVGWVQKDEDGENNLSEAEKEQPKILREISKMLLGFNPVAEIGKIDLSQLPSVLKADGIKSDVDNKNIELSNLVQKLPETARIQASFNDISKLGKSKDLKKIKADLAKLNQGKNEANSYVKQLTTAGSTVAGSIRQLNKTIGDLDTDITGDLGQVLSQLSLPDLEFKGLAEELFGKEIDDSLAKLKAYYKYIEPHLKKLQKEKVEKIEASFRKSGERIIFSDEKIPGFWLKKASIKTSKTTDSYKDSLSGNIKDLTTALDLTQLPMTFEVAGSLESLDIPNFSFDSRVSDGDAGVKFNSSLALSGLSVVDRGLSESESLNLKIKNSTADMKIGFGYYNQATNVDLNTVFTNVKYDIRSDDQRVLSTLKPIITSIDKITLSAEGKGDFSNLSWKVASNLADKLKYGLSDALSNQIRTVKKTITRKVRDEIGQKKERFVCKGS